MHKEAPAQSMRQGMNSIDLMKLIMAFAVVAIHARPLANCRSEAITTAFNSFTSLAVPFFFLASGFLISRRMSFPCSSVDIEVLKKHLRKIAKLYIVWMLIYTPLAVYQNIVDCVPLSKCILLYIRGLFLIGEQYNSWHLWYLLSTIYSMAVIILLLRVIKSPKGLLYVAAAFSVVSIGLDRFVSVDVGTFSALKTVQSLIVHSISGGRIFRGLIYIPIGMYLAHVKPKPLSGVLLLISGFVLSQFVKDPSANSFILIFTAVGLFISTKSIKLSDSKIYLSMRNMSTVIYLIHMYVLSIFCMVAYGTMNYGPIPFLVTASVSAAIALVYVQINGKAKIRQKF